MRNGKEVHWTKPGKQSVILFQLGETQLKGLLERVSEQTQKTTTVKVSDKHDSQTPLQDNAEIYEDYKKPLFSFFSLTEEEHT